LNFVASNTPLSRKKQLVKKLNLPAQWQVKQIGPDHSPLTEAQASDGWLPATVPGSIHQDLIQAGKIADPFFSLNENDVQWVGEADWLYQTTFDVPAELLETDQLDLVFDGLDTFASIWINGELLLTSDNMFVPQRRSVKGLLKASGNVILARFESAFRHGKALEAQYGKLPAWNGDISRVYVRKAQYHYGWDWGPVLLTAGFWRAVRIEAYNARILDVNAPAAVSDDLREAIVSVQVDFTAVPIGASITVRLTDADNTVVSETTLPASGSAVQHTITVTAPALWYPNGHGEQPRYKLTVTLHDGEKTLDSNEQLLGLRRLRLVQEPLIDAPGTSFYFEVNNIPLFCGGANWIPADSFTPRVTIEKYRAWLQMAADSHMVMLRVWGGGIYEEDAFYDLCDEMGLLVWQDFMFACGIYPAHPEFLANVRAEAEANVRRLRNHPSLAIWCGNNEDYQIAEAINAYDPDFNGDFTKTAFPAREIYERLLPEVCGALDPNRQYWPGSPYGGRSVADQTLGDRHTWDVWHGKMADYRDYPLYTGRFVSEFGMQSAPIRQTIEGFTRPDERQLNSPVLRHHNKAVDGMERLAHYIESNIPEPTTLDGYIYGTQFIQSEALAVGIEGWRRLWAGPGRYANSGALVWQINDCWPVISWAIADYDLNRKPAYYRIRRALAPIALGVGPKSSNAADGVVIWATNATSEVVEVTLDVQLFDLDGTRHAHESKAITLTPLQSTELGAFFANLPTNSVVGARLIQGDAVIARAAHWPEPPKQATYSDPGLTVTFDGQRVTLRVQRPARGVVLTMPNVTDWSDNMIDLLPGDAQVITVQDGDNSGFSARWYGAAES
jgi:beta-mannosidase